MGFAQVGKDETARILVERYDFVRVAFADTLREMCLAVDPYCALDDHPLLAVEYDHFARLSRLVAELGWDEAKKIADVRRLLQRMGTEAGRDILGPDFWVTMAFDQKIIPALNNHQDVVVTDMRFPNEIAAVRGVGGVVWRLDRRGIGPQNGHSSEAAWTKHRPDFYVRNDGTLDELRTEVTTVLAWSKDSVAA